MYVKGQPFIPQFIDPSTGSLMASGTVEFYLYDTNTPTPYYTNSTGTSGGTSLTLGSGGKPSTDIFFNSDIIYKIVVKNAAGTTLDTIKPYYPVGGGVKAPRCMTMQEAIDDATLSVDDVLIVSDRGNSTWDVVLSSGVTENGYNIVQGVGVGTLSFVLRTSQGYINAAMTGATYDDSTNDAAAIQAAIDALGAAGGGTVYITGPSRLSVTKGTNDKWGIKIPYSNVTVKINGKGSLRRTSSDISTPALSFPLILIGKPDDNDLADQVTNVKIKGGRMIGENTRHSTSGSALMDGRQAIWIKNADGVDIEGVRFSAIDSGAIWLQKPGDYDQENGAYYNTTKCYNVTINKNKFIGTAHPTPGRALLHAIRGTGDDITCTDNYFSWCDAGFICDTTYDEYDDVESDTFMHPQMGVLVKLTGKGFVVSGNTFRNSSEHCLYINGMGATIGPNNVVVDDATICNAVQYLIRGRNVSITGGTMTGVGLAGGILTGATDVTWTGTIIHAVGDSSGGVVQIQSEGLTVYKDASSAFWATYKPMRNIRVDITINMPEAAQTHGVAIRLYTDTTDANFPYGQMINVNLSGTTINNAKKAILNVAPMAKNVQLDNMIFNGKPFTETNFGATGAHDGLDNVAALTDNSENWTTNQFVGWTIKNKTDGSQATVTGNTDKIISGTLSGGSENLWDIGDVWQLVPPLNSLSVISVSDTATAALQECSFSNNKIKGFQYILKDDAGAGGAGSISPPYGVQGNEMNYVEFWDSAAFAEPSFETRFRGNRGTRFLDRTGWFSTSALENSLSDGSSNSERKGCMLLVGAADVRLYYDDSGNYKAL